MSFNNVLDAFLYLLSNTLQIKFTNKAPKAIYVSVKGSGTIGVFIFCKISKMAPKAGSIKILKSR